MGSLYANERFAVGGKYHEVMAIHIQNLKHVYLWLSFLLPSCGCFLCPHLGFYRNLPDKCYKIITEKQNIMNAFTVCHMYGAQLADLQESVVERYATQDSNLTFWFLKHYSSPPFGTSISLQYGKYKNVDFFKGQSVIDDFDDENLERSSAKVCSYYLPKFKKTADCGCSEKHAFFCWIRPSEPLIFSCLLKQFFVYKKKTKVKLFEF